MGWWAAIAGEVLAAGCFVFYVVYQPNEGDH